jgi:Malectin domain
MAELFWTDMDQRIFNVAIEGQARLTNYDIVASTGDRFMAETYEFNESVVDGFVSIHFTAVKDNAQVSGIEIYAA